MSDSGTAVDGCGSAVKGAATTETTDGAAAVAPAEAAHWALGRMFGGGEGELRRMAADLAALGARMDGLSREISSALGRLSWHGTASDAFVRHARERVKEIRGVADDLGGLSRSVERLVDVH
jgi:hypothetical protein